MQFNFDWKFAAAIAMALMGVLVPIVLWVWDKNPSALEVKIQSVTAMHPISTAPLDGFQLLFNGEKMEAPFLSVVEISNTGSRPILKSDFESKIELFAQPDVNVLNAEIGLSEPTDLRPVLSFVQGVIFLEPLLLNPGDKFQLSILTSRAEPVFSVRARIAGINTVGVSDRVDLAKKNRRYWLVNGIAVIVLVVYIALISSFAQKLRYRKFDLPCLVGGMSCSLAALLLLDPPSGDILGLLKAVGPHLFIAGLIAIPYVRPIVKSLSLGRPPSRY